MSALEPDSLAYDDRTRAEGKRHDAALICLARRRCDVILATLRTGEHHLSADQLAARTTAETA